MSTTDSINLALLNSLDHGAFVIDYDGTISGINKKARDIIGFSLDNSHSHPAGTLSEGDIVIIADNSIGSDDGELSADDLKHIGIIDPDISQGDILVAAGVYHDERIRPEYKHFYSEGPMSNVILAVNYQGTDIIAEVNQFDSNTIISVGGDSFQMNYFRCVGNMVILDGKTQSVKFYQDRGYTLRKESIREILLGAPFREKSGNIEPLDPTGENILRVIEQGSLTECIKSILAGEINSVKNNLMEINRRMMICSLSPIKQGEDITGVIVSIEDASSIETLIKERNDLIDLAENTQNKHVELKDSDSDDPFPEFYGKTAPMKQVKYLAKRAINSKANVWITGDSGTGKSRLAFEIHNAANPELPFVEVNCASIPQALFESELFGYVGGAFTGALKNGKTGYFESANGGTLFLDEIGEIPIEVQVKLLQALQTRRIYRVGSTTPINVNIRIIAATNMDIADAVKQGKFRQDLYYRLNVYPIHIPPLREHPSDIYIISNNILKNICSREGIPQKQLSASCINKIMSYPWPGNIRELENIIERAVMPCDGAIVFPEYIDIDPENPENIGNDLGNPENTDVTPPIHDQAPMTMKEAVDSARRSALQHAMEAAGGDNNEAMRILKLSKTTFYDYLKRYL